MTAAVIGLLAQEDHECGQSFSFSPLSESADFIPPGNALIVKPRGLRFWLILNFFGLVINTNHQ